MKIFLSTVFKINAINSIYFFILILLLALTSNRARSSDKSCEEGINDTLQKPNVVLIMVDDMGFSDIGCYGSEIKTPNIDLLAEKGLKFSQFYNAGRCCPSRASLLTGKYSHTVDMGWMTGVDMQRDGYRGDLKKSVPTIADALKSSGYHTSMVGKWHLALSSEVENGTSINTPTDRGFQEFYGTMEGAKDYYNPKYLYRNKKKVSPDSAYFYTNAITDSALTFIEKNGNTSFFLYVAFYAPHFPLQAPNDIVQSYKGKYQKGWDHLRSLRFEKQQKMGLFSPSIKLSEDTSLPSWDNLSSDKKNEMDFRMAIYAAQVETIDRNVGNIVKKLKQQGIFENTLIIFLSDNGGLGGADLGMGNAKDLNKSDTPYTSYGKAWGNVSNTPYKKYKSFTHEGGIIAPLIISWPSKLKSHNSFINQPLHIIDLFPTIGAICGMESSQNHGMDFSAWLLNPTKDEEVREMFWEHEGTRAIRSGNWKLVSSGVNEPWELYNLHKDPTELKDFSLELTEVREDLSNKWMKWAELNNVLPLDGSTWEERIRTYK